MRKNKIKQMMAEGKPVVNGWLSIPSTVSAEAVLGIANQPLMTGLPSAIICLILFFLINNL